MDKPAYSFSDVTVSLAPAFLSLDVCELIDVSAVGSIPFEVRPLHPFIDLKASVFKERGLKIEDAFGATINVGSHKFRVISAADLGTNVIRLTLEDTARTS